MLSRYPIAVCFVQLKPGTNEIQLTPDGAFRAVDGRPVEVPAWKVDAAIARRVIDKAAARKTPLVIDYEHQTLHAEKNGQPAPAAGRFKRMEYRPGVGIVALDVSWTDKARAMIEAEEYLYISPVFRYHPKTGEVVEMLMAGLTNNPGVDGMDAVTLQAAARFSFDHNTTEESDMKELLAALCALLGLTVDVEDEQKAGIDITNAVTALKAKADKAGDLETQVVALKAQGGNPDPAKFVPIETVTNLQTQLAELTARVNTDEVDRLVNAAIEEGKLVGMEDWARDLGKKDIVALKTYIEKAPVVAALTGTQTGGKKPAQKDGELSEDQLAVCTRMGISVDDFKKANGIGQAAE